MNLLTPIAGFLIGYGGIMGYQVIDSTYKGEMPGPKSFGYFIGGMTLLSAATIYALGRTDKVFNAGGLSQFTPNELTQSSAIHGDFDHASLNYSGHQNMILRGESFAVDVTHRKDGIEVGDNSIANEYQCGECDIVYDNSSDATICCKCSSCDEPIHEGDCIKYAETFNVEFDADGNYNDFIEDMEGVMGKYGEMKDFDSGYNPKNNLLKARMVVEVDDEDFDNVDFDAESFYDNFGDMEYILLNMLTDEQLEEEYGDFMRDEGVGRKELPQRLQDRYRTDEEAAYLREKYLESEDFDAEMMMPEKQCVICGGPYTGYGHNPEPIFPMSRGRCCDVCNATVVIPYRLGGMNFRFGEDFEAQTVRKFRNRFDKTSPRGNRRSRAATGVKRNIWKNFFRKDAEDMPDELDMVMAQLYEIEDKKNPTPEDLTNYQNLLTRYYEIVSFNAEQKTARVRTLSGKPVSETLRKLKQDKNLSAKDARTRKEIKAENMEVFEAPKTMTELQAKRKVIALMKPYWLKDLKTQRGPKLSRKQYTAKYGDDAPYEMNMEDWDWWDYHVKTVQSGKYGGADPGGDTILREALPYSYWAFINEINPTWEGSEKYDDEPYETMYLGSDFCIYDRTTPWSEWSASDKRKLNKLEKRWEEEDDMDFMDYIEQKDAIEHKYDKTVQHRNEASKMNCKHCGPYLKNRANIKNWDVLGMMEDGTFFYYWEYPASLKKQVKALIPALKGIKPKPKARAKKISSLTIPKAKAAKKTTTRKAKPKAKAKAKTGRKAPTISATRRKIGTRMRGNDGKMWEVKKSGKSQRWMAGAETFEATGISDLDRRG